jgi:hypothetical protein
MIKLKPIKNFDEKAKETNKKSKEKDQTEINTIIIY